MSFTQLASVGNAIFGRQPSPAAATRLAKIGLARPTAFRETFASGLISTERLGFGTVAVILLPHLG